MNTPSLAGLTTAGFLVLVSGAEAHVRVLPVESKTGGHQTYTMKVPTEGKVTTTSVELEIPAGVSVVSTADPTETKVTGGITTITWTVRIPPGQSQNFDFVADNPKVNQAMSWKAHQHYADGTGRDWVDLPMTKSPASITTLSADPQLTAH
jgi:uncharacterized protein YcnI